MWINRIAQWNENWLIGKVKERERERVVEFSSLGLRGYEIQVTETKNRSEFPFRIEEFHWTFFSNQRTKSSNPHQKNLRLIWPKLLNTFSNCSSGKIAAFALSHMLWMCSLISRTMWRISFLSVGVRTCMDVSHMCELFVGSGLISFSHSFECRLCDFPREKHVYAARDAPFWPPLSQTHTHKLTRSLICSCIFTQLTCHWIFRIVLRITHSIIIVNNV